jgi:hypothetical protein
VHHATCVSPSDNKSILGGLKSILGVFYKSSDNASKPQQLSAGHRSTATDHHSTQLATGCSWPQSATDHHKPISWPPQAENRPKTQQNQGKISDLLREKQRLLMTLCPPIEKSIILLFHYCMHPVILFHYCIYPVILYKTTVILEKMVFFLCVREDPPPTQKI